MVVSRRTFLTLAAGAPAMLGLKECFSAEKTDVSPRSNFAQPPPPWYQAGLLRMRERKLHGVVLIAPGAAPVEQRVAGSALWRLLEGPDPDVHELFMAGVFIGMT